MEEFRLMARQLILIAALLLGGCASMHEGMHASHQASAAKNRVVIQVSDNDPAKWNLALNNARNVQTDLGASNVEIEIVAYGPGLNMVKTGSAVASRIDEANLGGTKIVACENTMVTQKVTREQILPGVSFVGAGVVEIMRRQQEGWSYLRP
jgi:intracellular sulfur oxidation DsrE/DsrF family protein